MSKNTVIVALPRDRERVYKVSSEKVPHLTLLFLGETDKIADLQGIIEFTQHAVNVAEQGEFMLDVDHRGTLGEDQADVLFFSKRHGNLRWLETFRSQLLQNAAIRAAYDSTEQYPEWTPHLTLGYPESPAKNDDKDYPYGIDWVSFDRIAVWTGDFDGPEFRLEWPERYNDMDGPMAMSDISTSGQAAVAELLGARTPNQVRSEAGLPEIQHYGVKGMRWGHRKENEARERDRGMFDPEKHDLTTDVVKAVVWPLVPPLGLFAIPADIRLARAGGRALKAKAVDMDEKRFQAKAQSTKRFVDIHNGASDKINRKLDGINKNYPDESLKNPRTKKKYEDEVVDMMQAAYRESANSIGNRSGTMHLDLEFRNDGLDFVIKAKEGKAAEKPRRVEHADSDDIEVESVELTITGKLKRSESGHIFGLDFDELKNRMVHTAELGEEFIEHFGVKGMRWGVRKERGGGSERKLTVTSDMHAVTKRAVRDHNEMPENDFRRKYGVSKKLYAKRVDRYGDPYMKSPMAKVGKKLAGKSVDEPTGKESSLLKVDRQGRNRWQPKDHSVEADVAKALLLPFGTSIPSTVRLGRRVVNKENAAGLKRGVQSLGTKLGDSFWQSSVYSDNGHERVHNQVGLEIDHKVTQLASAPKYRGKNLNTDHKLRTEYEQDLAKVTDAAYRRAVKDVYGSNSSDTKRVEYVHDARGPRLEILENTTGRKLDESKLSSQAEIDQRRTEAALARQARQGAQHADTAQDPDITIELAVDENGFVSGVGLIDLEEAEVEHLAELGEAFLIHYGVKGMKWGVRKERFQSGLHERRVTQEAKRREKRPAAEVRAYPTIGESKRKKAEIDTKGGEDHPPTDDAVKVAAATRKLKKSGVKALSNEELQTVQRRLNLENDVERLLKGNKTAGQQFVDSLLGRADKNDRKSNAGMAGNAARKTALPVAAKVAKTAVPIVRRAIIKV